MAERDCPLDSYPIVNPEEVAWVTETQMIEADRVMVEELHIDLPQMMENAGRNLARLVVDLGAPDRVAVAAGSGGNGGGGMVAARHLANMGVDVVVTTTRGLDGLSPAAAHQFDILGRMGVGRSKDLVDGDLTIDAIIGYSLRGAPTGRSASLIEQTNGSSCVVALDVPSGLDVTTGVSPGSAVRADVTMTLALPKVGLRGATTVGDLYLADISVPPSVLSAHGPVPDFSASSLIRIAQ